LYLLVDDYVLELLYNEREDIEKYIIITLGILIHVLGSKGNRHQTRKGEKMLSYVSLAM